jgi:hypothetical protein
MDLGSFLASHKSKIFLAMRGTAAPFKSSQKEGGTSLFWQFRDVSFGWGPAPKKSSLFSTTFLKQKQVLAL